MLKIIDQDSNAKLLEHRTINDRTLIATYYEKTNAISIFILHISKINPKYSMLPEMTDGFIQHIVNKIHAEKEAAELVCLYLQDMESDNCWWEEY